MMVEAALLIMSLAVVGQALIRERSFGKERQQWNEERQKLLDRIQAGDLSEYKAFEIPATPRPEPEKPADDLVRI